MPQHFGEYLTIRQMKKAKQEIKTLMKYQLIWKSSNTITVKTPEPWNHDNLINGIYLLTTLFWLPLIHNIN